MLEQEVINRGKALSKQFKELLSLAEDASGNKKECQQRLKALKSALRDELKIKANAKSPGYLHGYEAAIQQTEADLSPLRWNSDPRNEDWYSTIAYAYVSLEHWIFERT